MFGVNGTKRNGGETTTVNFDKGIYIMVFWGQVGQPDTMELHWQYSAAAVCIAFYQAEETKEKPNKMTVVIGQGGGSGSGGTGGGKTVVTTNFALPQGYSGTLQAMAAGGGAGYNGSNPCNTGVFKGWNATSWSSDVGGSGRGTSGNYEYATGLPASQTQGGLRVDNVRSPNGIEGGPAGGTGGGAGFHDGGGGKGSGVGGGGSCTPWCYPLCVGDMENGPRFPAGHKWANRYWCQNKRSEEFGSTYFYRIDPTVMPSGAEVNLAEDPEATAAVTAGGVGPYTPVSAVGGFLSNDTAGLSYDCGIETGWVFRRIWPKLRKGL